MGKGKGKEEKRRERGRRQISKTEEIFLKGLGSSKINKGKYGGIVSVI